MVEINNSNKTISVTQGDSISFTVTANTNYPANSTVSFSVKKNARDIDNLINYEVDVENDTTRVITVNLNKNDTNIQSGHYVYSIRVIKGNSCNTPIETGNFNITNVVGKNTVTNNE